MKHSDVLEQARQEAGGTDAALARRLGYKSRQTIGNWWSLVEEGRPIPEGGQLRLSREFPHLAPKLLQ